MSRRTDSQKQRLQKVFRLCAVLLLGGCAYAVFCRLTGLGIPCLFHKLTGLLCPGCGVSRMCLSLLRLDFAGAWQYNPMILCLLPFGLAVAVNVAVRYVKTGSVRPDKWANILVWIMIAALLIFGVARNL